MRGSSGPTQYTIGDGMGGSTVVTNLGDAITNIDGRTINNESAIGSLESALAELEGGTVGLVRQPVEDGEITVGAQVGGGSVTFANVDGDARVLTGVADGEISETSLDAINGSQLYATRQGVGDVAAALGGGALYDPVTGAFTGPTYAIGGTPYTNVGDALTAQDAIVAQQGQGVAGIVGGGAAYDPETGTFTPPQYTVGDGAGGTTVVNNLGDAVTNIDGRTTANESSIAGLEESIAEGTVGLVQQDATTRVITVAAGTDGDTVDFTNNAGAARVLTGVAMGDISETSTDAISGAQMFEMRQTLAQTYGGGATVDPITREFSGPVYILASGAYTNVGDALLAQDNLVSTQGSTTAAALGGGSTYDPATGTLSAPTYMVGGTPVTGVEGAITNIDGRTTSLEESLAEGTVGLVQQDATTRVITVAAGTDGDTVDFTNNAGDARVLTGVADGEISETSLDAINGSQLYATRQGIGDVAAALGGGALYDPVTGAFTGPTYAIGGTAYTTIGDALAAQDAIVAQQGQGVAGIVGGGAAYDPATGTFTPPQYTVGDGAGGTTLVTNLGDAITNIDGRTVNNESAISELQESIAEGSVGLVRQAGPTEVITVGAQSGGTTVDFANSAGEARVLTGVAAANQDDEAVNLGQLNQQLTNVYNQLQEDLETGTLTLAYFQANSGPDENDPYVGALAQGDRSIAVGQNAMTQTGAERGLALGADATAAHADSVALGAGSTTVRGVQAGYSAFGLTDPQDSAGEVSIGTSGNERQITNLAAGEADTDAVNVAQLRGVSQTLGGALAEGLGGGAAYDPSTGAFTGPQYTVGDGAGGTTLVTNLGDAITNIDGRTTANESSIASLEESIATGGLGLVQQDAATRVITVAAGTDGGLVNFANNTGAARVLTGVAPGEISETSTDAINGSQLFATNQSITQVVNNVTQLGDQMADLENRVAQIEAGGGGGIGGGTVDGDNSVAVGDGSNATGDDALAAGGGAVADGNGATAVGADSNAVGDNASAIGSGSNAVADNATAVGSGATASGENASAVGAGSNAAGNNASAIGSGSNAVADNSTAVGTGATASGENASAIGAGSNAVADNSTAVGAGAVANNPNDVALGAGSVSREAVGVDSATINGVTYDGFAGSNPVGAVSVGAEGAERQIQNVAAGRITADSTDAVNGSQIYSIVETITSMGDNVGELAGRVEDLTEGRAGFSQVNNASGRPYASASGNDSAATGAGAVASGDTSLAVGTGATASGDRSSAVGPNANAAGTGSTALGSGSSATADNSVALGAGSVADRANTVSVGAAGAERQITNVAPGTAGTDAVNVNQLTATMQENRDWTRNYVDQRMDSFDRNLDRLSSRANAGIAAAVAMASLPQAYQPNQNSMAVAAGSYHGESGFAVGMSRISEDGRWIYKVNASTNTRGDGSVGVGAALVW
ncbi:YadA-like family protein [Coralloluteibacterium thermophilus]|uniref:YadA-like family protein n=1 Tax=Coralloluteibacterium thermophilum TaxID=2707049 RepID=A0ABV9NJ90_9GAMM